MDHDPPRTINGAITRVNRGHGRATGAPSTYAADTAASRRSACACSSSFPTYSAPSGRKHHGGRNPRFRNSRRNLGEDAIGDQAGLLQEIGQIH
jgi:hypothetical protein